MCFPWQSRSFTTQQQQRLARWQKHYRVHTTSLKRTHPKCLFFCWCCCSNLDVLNALSHTLQVNDSSETSKETQLLPFSVYWFSCLKDADNGRRQREKLAADLRNDHAPLAAIRENFESSLLQLPNWLTTRSARPPSSLGRHNESLLMSSYIFYYSIARAPPIKLAQIVKVLVSPRPILIEPLGTPDGPRHTRAQN